MIKALHHADIIIPNGAEDSARNFYCNLLGFSEIEKPDVLKSNGGLWLQLSNAQIHLSYEKKEGIDPAKTKAHLAYVVDNIEALEKSLIESNCPVKKQVQLPGMLRLETEDPFGHRIEFIEIIQEDKL
ncbi:MAG: VOC family protein [Pseudobdellovibrionaceae bacterium]|nr:MAG: VOC family protein [Pseudobdellovibrionaceae bacterium]